MRSIISSLRSKPETDQKALNDEIKALEENIFNLDQGYSLIHGEFTKFLDTVLEKDNVESRELKQEIFQEQKEIQEQLNKLKENAETLLGPIKDSKNELHVKEFQEAKKTIKNIDTDSDSIRNKILLHKEKCDKYKIAYESQVLKKRTPATLKTLSIEHKDQSSRSPSPKGSSTSSAQIKFLISASQAPISQEETRLNKGLQEVKEYVIFLEKIRTLQDEKKLLEESKGLNNALVRFLFLQTSLQELQKKNHNFEAISSLKKKLIHILKCSREDTTIDSTNIDSLGELQRIINETPPAHVLLAIEKAKLEGTYLEEGSTDKKYSFAPASTQDTTNSIGLKIDEDLIKTDFQLRNVYSSLKTIDEISINLLKSLFEDPVFKPLWKPKRTREKEMTKTFKEMQDILTGNAVDYSLRDSLVGIAEKLDKKKGKLIKTSTKHDIYKAIGIKEGQEMKFEDLQSSKLKTGHAKMQAALIYITESEKEVKLTGKENNECFKRLMQCVPYLTEVALREASQTKKASPAKKSSKDLESSIPASPSHSRRSS